jgi:hypothetical protein
MATLGIFIRDSYSVWPIRSVYTISSVLKECCNHNNNSYAELVIYVIRQAGLGSARDFRSDVLAESLLPERHRVAMSARQLLERRSVIGSFQ